MASIGSGCTSRNDGLPPHNPRPSTPRGKRRHSNRSPERKKMAEAAWERDRSKQESRYQRKLMESNSRNQ